MSGATPFPVIMNSTGVSQCVSLFCGLVGWLILSDCAAMNSPPGIGMLTLAANTL